MVDEADLLAAAEAAGAEAAVCSCAEKCAAGAVNTDCPVCSVNMGKCVGAEPEPVADPVEEPEPEPEPYAIYDPTVMPEGGERDGVKYAAYDGLVEHLFFHPIIAYPELAFDGDAQEKGLDDYMVTVDEFNKILESCYANGYVLVDICDVWSETVGEDGQPRMARNNL